MTKKDYLRLAGVFANMMAEEAAFDMQGDDIIKRLANDVAQVLADDNPRFDYKKFIAACGAGEKE